MQSSPKPLSCLRSRTSHGQTLANTQAPSTAADDLWMAVYLCKGRPAPADSLHPAHLLPLALSTAQYHLMHHRQHLLRSAPNIDHLTGLVPDEAKSEPKPTHLSFYFINGSVWGPKLRDYLESTIIPLLPDFIMIIETKLTDSPSRKAQKWFHKRGYIVKFSAAAKGTGTGRKGGVLIAWLYHLNVDPLAPQRHTQHTNIQGGRGPDWALVLLRVKKASYLIGPVYLTSGQGFEQDNFTKLYQIRRCNSFYLAHLAISGDFN